MIYDELEYTQEADIFANQMKYTKPLAAYEIFMANIEAGNVMYKTLTYLANSKNAGIILGAKAPIILTSRADSDEAKLYSILLAVICSKRRVYEAVNY